MLKTKLADLGMLILLVAVAVLVVFALLYVLTYLFAFIADNISGGYSGIVPASIVLGAGIIAVALHTRDN